ncbi:MAG: hypothetical protein IJY24_07550, partial [Clostridia bacterium]|nr:hypothetical protein [Clostridia bacterium]
MKKKGLTVLLSLLLVFAVLLTVALIATAEGTQKEDAMIAINEDSSLAGYKQGATISLSNDGYIGIPVEISVYYDSSRVAAPSTAIDSTPVILYVVNSSALRVGSDDDVSIIKSMVSRGWAVAVCDYKNNVRAVSPALDWSAQGLRTKLMAGEFFANKTVFPSGTYMNSFVVPSGYDVSMNNVFWEIDKHGTDGTLEKIVEIWNNDFRGVKGDTVIYWLDEEGNRKQTQNGFDGSAPVWLNANGAADEGGSYIRIKHTKAVDITDCVKRDGSPIDLNLYMHIIYPTGGAEVPVLALVGSAEHLAKGAATADRPQLNGAVFRGYAGIMFDHGYTPMARDDHYGYFDGNAAAGHITGDNLTYSIQFYNTVEIGTAAMRYIRYLSLSEEKYNFDLDAIGTYGNSKGGWHAFLGDPDPYATAERRIYPGHHGETRYENGKTETVGIIDGGEEQPWLTYNGESIDARSNFLYCSCGGTLDAISEGHSPTFITCNVNDGSYYSTSNQFVAVCRSANVPTMWFEVPLGHTFGYGHDTMHGVDVYDALFDFAGYWLKGEGVKVSYIEADMTYGGMPTYAPFTVKFTGSVAQSELAKITLKGPDGVAVEGFWTQEFGGTEWTYHPSYLKSNTTYTMTVPASVKGNNGVEMGKDFTYSVTTGYERAQSGTRVKGERGEYITLTIPQKGDITEFNVNKYLLRVYVENDAVNTLGAYFVNGFDGASPDSSTLGECVGTVYVNGRGYYEIDVTEAVSGLAGEVTFLVKQMKATGDVLVQNGDVNGSIPSGISVSGSVNKQITTLDGDSVLELGEFKLGTSYLNNHFYNNITVGTVIANTKVMGGSALTENDTGRRFTVSFKVYDTVSRYIHVKVNSCTSQAKGTADYNAFEKSFITKAGEWVDISFTYDIYEPEMFGDKGLAAKVMYINTYGFGDEVHPIYFDDFYTYENITGVDISDIGLVLSTTEQRKNPLETEYGVIPDSYADEEAYPFIVFDGNGKFITATDIWATDGGGGALGACAKQLDVNNVIVLRRDYTYADSTSYNNFAFVYGNVLIDLGGHTLTLAETHSRALFFSQAKRSSATNMKIRNGEILLGKNPLAIITGWDTANYDHKNLVKVFSFELENVKLGFASGSTAPAFITYVGGDAPVVGNMTLTDCEIDLANAPLGFTPFILGDDTGLITGRGVIRGGEIVGGDLSKMKFATLGNSASSFGLEKNADGDYPIQKINTGGAKLDYSARIDGVTYYFKESGVEGGYTLYSFRESPLDTPYGEIDAEFEDASAYPFALFGDNGDGSYTFITATDNIFADGFVTTYRDLDKPIVVYMRRNYTATTRFTNISQLKCGITYDLGENTLTANSASQTFYLLGNPQRHSTTTNISVVFKNGTVVTDSAKAFVLIGSNKDGGTVRYSLDFDNIKFDRTDNGTNAHPIVEFTASLGTFTTDITYRDCELDMRGVTTTLRLFTAGNSADTARANVTVLGGRIYLSETSKVALTYVQGASSSVKFGPGEDGYTRLSLPTGSAAPTYKLATVNDGEMSFSPIGSDASYDHYVIASLNTPYGTIPAQYSSIADYPFVLFQDNGDGTYTFKAAEKNIFLDASPLMIAGRNIKGVIYMRRDFTVTDRFTNINFVSKGLVFDMNNHTLFCEARDTNGNAASPYYACVKKAIDTDVTFKNGKIVLTSSPFATIHIVSSAGIGYSMDFTFENITFSLAEGATTGNIVATYIPAAGAGTSVLTFNNCIFDLRDNLPSSGVSIFAPGNADGKMDVDFIVNGGQILAKAMNSVTVGNVAAGGSLIFNKSEGEYITVTLPLGAAAPTEKLNTPEGVCGFVLKNGVYVLELVKVVKPVETNYGTIPVEYVDEELYPFVVFVKNSDGSYTFLGAEANVFYDSCSLMISARSKSSIVVLMRRDVEINTTFSNICFVHEAVYDLDGNSLTMLGSNRINNKCNTNWDKNITFKNGTIVTNGAAFMYLGQNSGLGNGGGYTTNTFFTDIIFTRGEGATAASPVIAFDVSLLATTSNVTFTDCSFDVANGSTLFIAGASDGLCTATVTVNGGVINAPSAAFTLVRLGNESSRVIFGEGSDGLISLSLPEGESAPSFEVTLADGKTGFFYKGEGAVGRDTYILGEKVNTDITVFDNITLYSDLIYNLYIPTEGVTAITVNGIGYDLASLATTDAPGVICYVVPTRVAVTEAGESISLVIGIGAARIERSASVIDYLERLIEDNSIPEATTLAKDILSYIRAAYVFAEGDGEVTDRIDGIIGTDYDAANMPTEVEKRESTEGLYSAAMQLGASPAFL